MHLLVHKKNCGDNPWCIQCLGTEEGIWMSTPSMVTSLGLDPKFMLRVSSAEGMIPVGLKNLGATCYINALIQSLYHNLLIRDAVFNITTPIIRIIKWI